MKLEHLYTERSLNDAVINEAEPEDVLRCYDWLDVDSSVQLLQSSFLFIIGIFFVGGPSYRK